MVNNTRAAILKYGIGKWLNLFVLYLLLTLFASHAWSRQVDIQFEIDLKDYLENSELTIENVGIRGNMPPLSWDKSWRLFDKTGQGIYSTKVSFQQPDNEELAFKFVLQGGLIWEEGEPRKLHLKNDQTYAAGQPAFPDRMSNPFTRYLGNWKFDQAGFSMVWDLKTVVTQKLAGQTTQCKQINTDRSILCVVSNKEDPNWTMGHMVWAYNSEKKQVSWLSHFYPDRIGTGSGTIDDKGNMTVKVTFQGEPEDTYRIYQWRWVAEDAYSMMSRQYSSKGELTGNWYGGTFIRAP